MGSRSCSRYAKMFHSVIAMAGWHQERTLWGRRWRMCAVQLLRRISQWSEISRERPDSAIWGGVLVQGLCSGEEGFQSAARWYGRGEALACIFVSATYFLGQESTLACAGSCGERVRRGDPVVRGRRCKHRCCDLVDDNRSRKLVS